TGRGDRSSLGELRIGRVTYAAGQPTGWLTGPGSDIGIAGSTVQLTALPTGLPEGVFTAQVPVLGVRQGADTLADTISVSFAVNRLDAAFDSPTLQIVQGTTPVTEVQVTHAASDTSQIAVRVKVQNPANTRLALTGLRVGSTQY